MHSLVMQPWTVGLCSISAVDVGFIAARVECLYVPLLAVVVFVVSVVIVALISIFRLNSTGIGLCDQCAVSI